MSRKYKHLPRLKPQKCSQCGGNFLLVYRAHGLIYCHSCFEAVRDTVERASDLLPRPLPGKSRVFFTSVRDERLRVELGAWVMGKAFIIGGHEELAYAFQQCGFIPEDLRKELMEAMRMPFQEAPDPPSRRELLKWDRAVRAYQLAREAV